MEVYYEGAPINKKREKSYAEKRKEMSVSYKRKVGELGKGVGEGGRCLGKEIGGRRSLFTIPRSLMHDSQRILLSFFIHSLTRLIFPSPFSSSAFCLPFFLLLLTHVFAFFLYNPLPSIFIFSLFVFSIRHLLVFTSPILPLSFVLLLFRFLSSISSSSHLGI